MRWRVLASISIAALVIVAPPAYAQVVYTGSAYTENFNTLSNTVSSASVPTGWAFAESGSALNTTYSVNDGTSSTGDTYSYGTASSVDRALGTLRTNTLTSTIGVQIQNGTGSTLTGLRVAYDGEQWRRGNASQADRLTFQWSTNASSISDASPAATWNNVTALDFASPITSGNGVALDGNATANRSAGITGDITGLTLADGGSIYFRWLDFQSSGQDDGLAIDNFSLTPVPEPGTVLAFAAGVLGVGGYVRRKVRRTPTVA